MKVMRVSGVAALLLLCSTSFVQSAKVTPVEKVVELLKSLQGKIEEEGKAEAAAYDKYACFCKEQADNKLYAIEKSTDKINALDAKIESLTADITSLNSDISSLSTQISDLETSIAAAVDQRNKEHASYVAMDTEMVRCIKALEAAIEAIKNGKMQMQDAKVDFAQLSNMLSEATGKSHAGGKQISLVEELSKLSKPNAAGRAHAYEYQSNDILATLENLKDTFLANKKEMDEEEFNTQDEFAKRKLGMENEKKFAEQEKNQKEAIVQEKTENKEAAESELTAETNDKNADQSFLDVLKTECETKATTWDQRSTTRASELTVIAQAIESLETGVVPNWSANKKLVDVQVKSHVDHGHWVYVESKPALKAQPSFLQLIGSNMNVQQQVMELLSSSAAHLKSSKLTLLAAKAKVFASKDHFVEVRGLIKDLIARLEADAQSEATLKSFCDNGMSEATANRDNAKLTIEDKTASIVSKTEQVKQLTADIADLSKQIADNQKSLLEATEFRAIEKGDNEKTIDEATAGKEAVDFAITVLNQFYQEQGAAQATLLQHGKRYVPPNSDREGKTVGDLAPEVFSGDYEGKKEPATNIIGILEVIASDFDRTITTVTEQEEVAVEDFGYFKSDIEQSTADMESEKEIKEGEKSTLLDDITTLEGEKKDAETLLADATQALEGLKKMCVDGEETYDERVEARKKEIEALKECLEIFENWKA